MTSLQPQRISTLQQLYPSVSLEILETVPTIEDWEATKIWGRQNLETCMYALDKGFAMYIAGTEKLLAVLGPTAVEEIRPLVEDAERETAGKEWDEEQKRWI